jgi:hypothetical protein
MTISPPPPSYSASTAASDKYNVLAIVGFVLAFFVSIGGLVVSFIALGQIKRTGERGRGLAIAGAIIGGLSLIIGIISVIALVTLGAQNGTSPY